MNKSSRIYHLYTRSVAMLLLLTAAAKFFSSFGSARILTARDPMFLLKYWQIMILVGLLELAVAIYLFRGRDSILKLFAILWLGSNFSPVGMTGPVGDDEDSEFPFHGSLRGGTVNRSPRVGIGFVLMDG